MPLISLPNRVHYYRRIFSAYLTNRPSHLTFWHELPEVNERASVDRLGEYYMTFEAKADYPGPYDASRIPMLDYHGRVGRQYNPIAIAQYGLGNFNLFRRTGDASRRERFIRVADWLVANLELNAHGHWVWNHHFDWEYRTPLKAPWYSALAQGQGLSVLARAHEMTGNPLYREALDRAFRSFEADVAEGGVACRDQGCLWFEETIVTPPTHILNGFLWALWGLYDVAVAYCDSRARRLFDEGVETLRRQLERFDIGYWSLYEQSGTRMAMLASPFYHSLHVVQLRVMHRLTGDEFFQRYVERWDGFQRSNLRRWRAIGYKSVFKLLYY